MIRGHGGEIYHLARELGLKPEEIYDFSSNTSPLPPPEGLYQILRNHLHQIESLPEVDSFSLRKALAERFGLAPENFFPSSGTTEWIFYLPEILAPKRVVIPGPTYADYEDAARRAGLPVIHVLAEEHTGFEPPLSALSEALRPGDLVFICNPNNPTGGFIPRKRLLELVTTHPETHFVIDESYLPFGAEERESVLTAHPFPENVMVFFSFSKIYRVPGLRLGALATGEKWKERISERERPWAVNRLAQIAGEFLVKQVSYEKRVRAFVREEIRNLVPGLKDLGFHPFPSRVHFLLLRVPGGLSGRKLRDHLLRTHRILIRACHNFYGLDDRFIRISLRGKKENRKLLQALAHTLRDLS